ncbi:MAG: RagB/SusD family nutrient uptake outer membrane protein [Tannerella sp.]|nr:RagB/SusD family nutrient uptake outer membrane protein [Tannerella sp.]
MVLLLAACSDFLEREPLDQLTDQGLTYTANQCKVYVNKYYTVWGSPSSVFKADVGSDNQLSYSYSQNSDLIDTRTVPASGGGWGTGEWGNIRSVNFLLDNYTKSTELDKAEAFVGEAKFFRAWYYFEQFLTKFGGVPWIETQLGLESPELYTPRAKRHEIADHILADLDYAIEKIPSFSAQESGRVSREVAQLYKARVALYEGTWEKYHAGTVFAGEGDVQKYLQVARDAALAVINSGVFTLDNVGVYDGYHLLFNQHDYSGSREIMLWRKYDLALGIKHGDSRNIGWNGDGIGLTRSLVDAYLCLDTDGKARPASVASNYQGDDNLLNVIANRDPRLTQTMYAPGRPRTINGKDTTLIFTKPSINRSDSEKCPTGYEFCKSLDTDHDQQFLVNSGEKGTPIFRYAEALLIYAEAKAELGELTQQDLDRSVNLLRDRVGMPHLSLDPGYTDPKGEFTAARGYEGVPVSNILQEIRRERRVELACEGFRHNDLKRWRAHHLWNHDKIQGCKTAQFEDLTWLVDFFKTFPVPAGINGGYDEFMNVTVTQWIPECVEGNNYWTDDEGYFAPYKNWIPDGHFKFDPNKAYLLPIPTDQLVVNDQLVQNPGWQ